MAGILDQILSNLGNPNPLMQMGLGILSASSRPGQTTGGAIGEGMLMGQNAIQQQRMMEMQQERERIAQERQQQQMAMQQEQMEQDAMRGQQLQQVAAQMGINPAVAAALGPDDLTKQIRDIMTPTDAIKTLEGLQENPALADLKRSMAAAGASRTQVNLPGQDFVPVNELGKVYNVQTGDPAPPGLKYEDLRSGQYAIREDVPVEQQKRSGYMKTAESALNAMDKFVADNPEFNPGSYQHAPGELPLIGPKLKGQSKRQFDALGNVAITSVLRPDTGAAATESELDSYRNTYLPSPGDSMETQEFKRELFRMRLQDFKEGTPEHVQLQMFEVDRSKLDSIEQAEPDKSPDVGVIDEWVYDPATGEFARGSTGGGF